MSEVDSDLADALGMNKPYGALINDVEEGESADNAGLMPGDVIIEFDNKEIKFNFFSIPNDFTNCIGLWLYLSYNMRQVRAKLNFFIIKLLIKEKSLEVILE